MLHRICRFAVLAALAAFAAASIAQTGWSRYRVSVPNTRAAQRLTDSSLGLFSEQVTLGVTDVIVGPGEGYKLWQLGLPYRFVSSLPDADAWSKQAGADADDYRNEYFNLDEVLAFYENLRNTYPSIVERVQIGSSRNGEAIWAYRFFNQRDREVPTPPRNYVMVGGIHAREWISPAVCMHLAHKLVDTFLQSETLFSEMLTDKIGVWIIPSINPDGYRYSWTNDRYWRKNRRNNGGGSYGVDLNRNFAKAWGGAGSSGNPGSETYRGPSAFSEPETYGLRDFCQTLPNLKAMIDWHSYGQYILWPWSYTTTPAPDDAWLRTIGNAMRDSMLAHGGATYEAGQGSVTLYIASGTSKDWFYDVFRAASYTIELRDTGQYGFVLPTNQITPTQDEAWWAFVAMVLQTP